MEEIPHMHNRTEIFVDPISYVVTSPGSLVHCNGVVPPRYKLSSKWYCSYPDLRECHDSPMLPVDEVQIETLRMNRSHLSYVAIWWSKSLWMHTV